MKKSENFAEHFIEKLNNNELKSESCPKPEYFMSDEFVEKELEKYNELLESGILNNATKDCRTCGNMSCRVEQHEKPVEGCLGYINHDIQEEKRLVRTLGGK